MMKELASKNLFADPHLQLLLALYPKCHPLVEAYPFQPSRYHLQRPKKPIHRFSPCAFGLYDPRHLPSRTARAVIYVCAYRIHHLLTLIYFACPSPSLFASFFLAPRVSHRYSGATACIYAALLDLHHLLSRGVGMNGVPMVVFPVLVLIYKLALTLYFGRCLVQKLGK